MQRRLRDYREHGHELPMDLWHGYIGSDTGFDPASHLAALVGEGFDRDVAQKRRDARKTELIAALDVMVGGARVHRRRETTRSTSRGRFELVARLGARPP